MSSWSSKVFFFCFKQKTAYEMRISDWSSDVCSSDLEIGADIGGLGEDAAAEAREDRNERSAERERGQCLDDDPIIGSVAGGAGQIPEEARDREQAEPGHQHAGDGARAEGEREAALERGDRKSTRLNSSH